MFFSPSTPVHNNYNIILMCVIYYSLPARTCGGIYTYRYVLLVRLFLFYYYLFDKMPHNASRGPMIRATRIATYI